MIHPAGSYCQPAPVFFRSIPTGRFSQGFYKQLKHRLLPWQWIHPGSSGAGIPAGSLKSEDHPCRYAIIHNEAMALHLKATSSVQLARDRGTACSSGMGIEDMILRISKET